MRESSKIGSLFILNERSFKNETRRKITEVAEGRGAGQDSECQACGSTAGREAERARPTKQTQVYDGRYHRKILP